jgi:hypothetical protein
MVPDGWTTWNTETDDLSEDALNGIVLGRADGVAARSHIRGIALRVHISIALFHSTSRLIRLLLAGHSQFPIRSCAIYLSILAAQLNISARAATSEPMTEFITAVIARTWRDLLLIEAGGICS